MRQAGFASHGWPGGVGDFAAGRRSASQIIKVPALPKTTTNTTKTPKKEGGWVDIKKKPKKDVPVF